MGYVFASILGRYHLAAMVEFVLTERPVRELKKHSRIDPKQILLFGASMGGPNAP